MTLAADAPSALFAIFAAILLLAAAQDAAVMRISNVLSGSLFALAIVAALVAGPAVALWQNVAVFALLLAGGTLLFATGRFGGGDVKLFAASGLWFDLDGGLTMIVAVLLAGGVLALAVIAARSVRWSETARQRVMLLRRGAGIPYGVAIALGALSAAVVQGS